MMDINEYIKNLNVKTVKFIDDKWHLQTDDNLLIDLMADGQYSVSKLPICDRKVMYDCSIEQLISYWNK